MPFVQRVIEPKYLSRTSLWGEDGRALVPDDELVAVTNNTLSNALRQLASLLLAANDIFAELGGQLRAVNARAEQLKVKIRIVDEKVAAYDPKKVTVPESDICTFALMKDHFAAAQTPTTGLFTANSRPRALQELYEAATRTPVHLMRQMDRWRRDGHRTSRFFLCTPVLGQKRRKIRTKVDIDIETHMPAAVKELRRWTSTEALGDITVTPDCPNRIAPNMTVTTDGEVTDGAMASDDEGIDHKLPSPEEQLQVVALKFPAEIVAVDVSGRSFDRMATQRRSLLHADAAAASAARPGADAALLKRKTRSRKSRSRRRNTLAGTDQKEIRDALTAGEEPSSSANNEIEPAVFVNRSKSSDLLRSSKKDSPDKKSHFNTLKQWGKSRYDRLMNKSADAKMDKRDDIDDFNIYETVSLKRKRNNVEKERRGHERNPSVSSSEKSTISVPAGTTPLSSVMNNIGVKLRDSSAQRRQRRSGANKDEPHSSSGNWSASSESGRASIGSEVTNQPKSTTSAATSSNSLNQQQAPNSVNSRRRVTVNTSTSSSITSEGTLTPDIIHDLHEDGETSSVYSCDTEGYYTSFHMDSGLKTLKEEDLPSTPLHSTSAFSNSSSCSNTTVLTAENEYELFGKGSTSTTTSSAGTVCTTLRASDSSRSLVACPAVPERKSSLSKQIITTTTTTTTTDKTGTIKRSPATTNKISVSVHKQSDDGDVSPDSGHNTSSSPIESINSPNGVRSGSEFEFSESSDMEGPERIERIRVKTAINSSRIPSMCVITPPHSDDESVKSFTNTKLPEITNLDRQTAKIILFDRTKLDLRLKPHGDDDDDDDDDANLLLKSSDSDKENYNIQSSRIILNGATNKMQLINVDPQSGYATIENFDVNRRRNAKRAPSPSGGIVTVVNNQAVKKPPPPPPPPNQPAFIKASLLPLNSVFGKLKSNLVNFARRESKSPIRNEAAPVDDVLAAGDCGDYVTLADVKNNNEKAMPNSVGSGGGEKTEYVSLNELPCNEGQTNSTTGGGGGSNSNNNNDSLERKRRQGARVTLDAEGKVVYSSDSLRRRKGAHTTFEPGPFVKAGNNNNNNNSGAEQSPVAAHRQLTVVKPVASQTRSLSPQPGGKLVIRAAAGTGAAATAEIVRMPPATIVAQGGARPLSPKSRGAYVHIQDTGSTSPAHDNKDRVQSPSNPMYPSTFGHQAPFNDMYNYRSSPLDENMERKRYLESLYYPQNGPNAYQTLPSKRTQFFQAELSAERSVTPDITRGLERGSNTMVERRKNADERSGRSTAKYRYFCPDPNLLNQKLGIPVDMPNVGGIQKVPSPDRSKRNCYISPPYKPPIDNNDSLRISPIDPRNPAVGFYSSTPSSKTAINLESKLLLSPKKSTMSNDELYAVIHKSKKKMNIETEQQRSSPIAAVKEDDERLASVKCPETGYIGDKSRSRLSWSPTKGDYIDFNADIDKLSPPNDSRSRQSWACSDRKGSSQTSRLDFKKLLLQKSSVLTTGAAKKVSAVEQLKLSKQQIQVKCPQPPVGIIELSGSPRSLVNRKFGNNNNNNNNNNSPASPKGVQEKPNKLMSPRAQWRFANPRSDVLSSTILEDCREDESPGNSIEKKAAPRDPHQPHQCSTNEIRPETRSNTDRKPYQSITQRLQAQRAQFFTSGPTTSPQEAGKTALPTLETAF